MMALATDIRAESGRLARNFAIFALVLAGLPGLPAAAWATPVPGQAAPAFAGTDTQGRAVSLSDYRGSIVVLEWTNNECPFVQRQYQSGNMQSLQKQAAAAGVVWLTIVSSAPGEQGFVDGPQADKLTADRDAAPRAVILDPSGEIGHTYGAKTTPHMYVIDPSGTLVYMGAIDDQPRITSTSPAEAHNYVRAALAALADGKPVATPVTQAYGCSVKYKG